MRGLVGCLLFPVSESTVPSCSSSTGLSLGSPFSCAQLTQVDFLNKEYSSFDTAKTKFEYALEYLTTLMRWRHPFYDFQRFYQFSKNELGGTAGRNMPHVKYALNDYVDQTAKGWPDFPLFKEAYDFHQAKVAGLITDTTDSANWALHFLRVNRRCRLGLKEYLPLVISYADQRSGLSRPAQLL